LNLLDPDIQKYVFKWEGAATDGIFKFIPEIQNKDEKAIGKIQLLGGMPSKKFCLCDIDDSILLYVGITGFTRESFEVNDSDNNKIGKVNRKIFSRRHILTMKNWKEEKELRKKRRKYKK